MRNLYTFKQIKAFLSNSLCQMIVTRDAQSWFKNTRRCLMQARLWCKISNDSCNFCYRKQGINVKFPRLSEHLIIYWSFPKIRLLQKRCRFCWLGNHKRLSLITPPAEPLAFSNFTLYNTSGYSQHFSSRSFV